jgi:hypothetical protein
MLHSILPLLGQHRVDPGLLLRANGTQTGAHRQRAAATLHSSSDAGYGRRLRFEGVPESRVVFSTVNSPLPEQRLDGLLLENAGKPAREQLTLIRIFEELRALGYEGNYDAVRRYAKRWRAERGAAMAEAFVPLSFAPGEAYQFDWSHEIVLINGVTVTVKVAHVRLCNSRMLFVRAYPRETQEMVFDAHNRAFAFFKGRARAASTTT